VRKGTTVSLDRRWPEGIYVRKLPQVDGKIYAQVIGSRRGQRIHVAGTLPFDERQELVGEGDVRAQTRCVLENIRRSLAEFGATPADVVRTKTYVIDMGDYLENGLPEWVEFFAGNPPTSTTVGVTEFADPRALVEIEAYAELD
jgi:enamine deaminase RidA (YjgF/YER057c/UK114 family)